MLIPDFCLHLLFVLLNGGKYLLTNVLGLLVMLRALVGSEHKVSPSGKVSLSGQSESSMKLSSKRAHSKRDLWEQRVLVENCYGSAQ